MLPVKIIDERVTGSFSVRVVEESHGGNQGFFIINTIYGDGNNSLTSRLTLIDYVGNMLIKNLLDPLRIGGSNVPEPGPAIAVADMVSWSEHGFLNMRRIDQFKNTPKGDMKWVRIDGRPAAAISHLAIITSNGETTIFLAVAHGQVVRCVGMDAVGNIWGPVESTSPPDRDLTVKDDEFGVELSWRYGDQTIDGFRIEGRKGPQNKISSLDYQPIAVLDARQRSYFDSAGLREGEDAQYRIAAFREIPGVSDNTVSSFKVIRQSLPAVFPVLITETQITSTVDLLTSGSGQRFLEIALRYLGSAAMEPFLDLVITSLDSPIIPKGANGPRLGDPNDLYNGGFFPSAFIDLNALDLQGIGQLRLQAFAVVRATRISSDIGSNIVTVTIPEAGSPKTGPSAPEGGGGLPEGGGSSGGGCVFGLYINGPFSLSRSLICLLLLLFLSGYTGRKA